MRPTFRSLAFGLATLLGAGAMAQNMVTITGTVQPCNGISYPVQIQTNTVPPIDTVVYSGPNCDYSFTFYPVQTQGTVTVTTTCDGGITFTSGTGSFTPLLGVVVIDLACGGGTLDCTGILNGPNMPGTACTTFLGEAGVWSANCVCEVTGNTVDCLGVIGGSALPGTPCDDGNAQTLNDTWTPFCSCLGSPAGECWAGYMVEPLMVSGVPVPWQVVFHVWSTGVEPFTVTWYVEGDVIVGGADLTYTVSGPGAITWAADVVDANGCSANTGDADMGMPCDGVFGGSALPGTACDDGDANTTNDTWSANCECVGVTGGNYDCLGVLNGPAVPGTACTVFGTVLTGIWSANCVCIPDSANTLDCLGILNGPNVPGAPCDDNNPLTANSEWNASCECVAVINVPCEADFWVMQAYTDTTGNPNGGGIPIPNVLWVWNLSSGGTGNYQFLWSFGDGTSSTDPFPTHTYAESGPYWLCLTISDDGGCTDTYCDSISVDENGMISGMGIEGNVRSAFTINVINPLTTGMPEKPELDQLATWPNPVTDELNIQLTSSLRGSVNLDILDLSGRTVLAGNRMLSNGSNRLSLPTGDLNPGMYLLRIGNGSEAQVLRFVKTR